MEEKMNDEISNIMGYQSTNQSALFQSLAHAYDSPVTRGSNMLSCQKCHSSIPHRGLRGWVFQGHHQQEPYR